MAGYGDVRTGRHRVFILHAHLAFITRYRHPVFGSRHLERTEELMRDVCADSGTGLAELSGEAGHVHLLVSFPPAAAISPLVSSLRGVSSRRLRQESRTCAATAGGRDGCGPGRTSPDRPAAPPIPVLRQYIEQRGRPA